MIDVAPDHLAEVRRILARVVPGCEVRAFGSRVNGRPGRHADLDLALVAPEKIDWRLIERLKDAFSESDLPFMVDVVDWNEIGEEFRKLVEKDYEVVQSAGAGR